MDQVLQDMENLDLDVTDETGAATAGDGTDATASGEESSGTESQPQETPGEAVLTGASTYMAQARIEREQIRSQNKESLLSIINNEALSETEKESAIASMVNMTDLVEKEAAAELLLEAKGFPDVVESDRRDSRYCSTGYQGGRCQQSADRGYRKTENRYCGRKYCDHADE